MLVLKGLVSLHRTVQLQLSQHGTMWPTGEGEVERFYEDLQDLLELTPEKGVLFIIGDCNAKVKSQETPGVTANLALECGMKQGKD